MRFSTVTLLLLPLLAVSAVEKKSPSSSLRRRAETTNDENTKRVIVQYKPEKRDIFLQHMTQAQSNGGMELHYNFESINTVVMTLPKEKVEAMEQDESVALIEEDPKRYPMYVDPRKSRKTMTISNSTQYEPEERKMTEDVSIMSDEVPYGINMVQAPDVWSKGHSGAGVTVCVVDTGIDQQHEDFDNLEGYLVSDNNLLWYEDQVGHGTHCSGTVAARENNKGVVGVAPDADVYTVKVFGNNGQFAYASGLVDAAERCVAAGADIISMSLGGPMESSLEEDAFKRIYEQDKVLNIAAAGNDGNTRKSYPASYDTVVSVAAVDSSRNLASFSQRNDMVDLAAPGVDVESTLPESGPCQICSGIGKFGYGAISGTSMATPHVAGVAALLMSAKPNAPATDIEKAMIRMAQDKGSPGRDNSYGHGIVQALDALDCLDDEEGCLNAPTPAPTADCGGWFNPCPDTPAPTPPSATPVDPTPAPTPDCGGWFEPPCSTPPAPTPNPEEPSVPTPAPTPDCGGWFEPPCGCGGWFQPPCETTRDGEEEEVTCTGGEVILEVWVLTDSYASSENSFELLDSNGNKIWDYGVGALANEQAYKFATCVDSEACYTLTFNDSYADGLCCGHGEGFFVASFDGKEVERIGSFGSQEVVKMGACSR